MVISAAHEKYQRKRPLKHSSPSAVLDLNDLYLCDGLGVRGAGLEHLDLLVDVGRVDPLGAGHPLRLLLRVRREEGAERAEKEIA